MEKDYKVLDSEGEWVTFPIQNDTMLYNYEGWLVLSLTTACLFL